MTNDLTRHPSTEVLSRAAIEGLPPDVEQHVAGCTPCTALWSSTRQVDQLARQLPAVTPSHDRSESTLAELLATTQAAPPAARSPRFTWWQIAIPTLVASAAAVAVAWLAPRRDSEPAQVATAPAPSYHGTVHAQPGARFTRESGAPDEVVRLEAGTIQLDVAALAPGERFRVIAKDAELDARGGSFEASVANGTLAAVQVVSGSVAVKPSLREQVVLIAGQQWSAEPVTERTTLLEEVAPVTPTGPRDVPRKPPAPAKVTAEVAPRPVTPPAVATAPMAEAFERGFQELKRGQLPTALAAFDDALARYPRDPLAEDVSFWRGVALVRLGRSADAIKALDGFLDRYAGSPRAGEASAMLGWVLLEAGRLDDAEARFRAAVDDRVATVKDSARRGLAAVATARANRPAP